MGILLRGVLARYMCKTLKILYISNSQNFKKIVELMKKYDTFDKNYISLYNFFLALTALNNDKSVGAIVITGSEKVKYYNM